MSSLQRSNQSQQHPAPIGTFSRSWDARTARKEIDAAPCQGETALLTNFPEMAVFTRRSVRSDINTDHDHCSLIMTLLVLLSLPLMAPVLTLPPLMLPFPPLETIRISQPLSLSSATILARTAMQGKFACTPHERMGRSRRVWTRMVNGVWTKEKGKAETKEEDISGLCSSAWKCKMEMAQCGAMWSTVGLKN